ncbi:hypothetical protein MMC26_004902 [Xylographa opegraphella]|nr:hypothetical protein [Xylographa opegraphella]
MSVPRLPFLYPHLFRSLRIAEPYTTLRTPAPRVAAASNRQLHKTGRKRQETYAQRYGPATEPPPPPPHISQKPEDRKLPVAAQKQPRFQQGKESDAKDNSRTSEVEGRVSPKLKNESADTDISQGPDKAEEIEKVARLTARDAEESHPKEAIRGPRQEATTTPLETVLHIEAPTSNKSDEHKIHMHAPPYVHHFDTYTLVNDLGKGGFTQDQSITIMKAVRSLLAINLDVAREELVSKSDVENETYLFRAACSELRTEIQNLRKISSEKMRIDRAHLQHEVDILNQKLTQDSMTLKDDLRGMFNDRKMAVRMEQRSMDSAIQELNYKITVALNSDSRGEVEGLRWVLTRRAAMAIVGMACKFLFVCQSNLPDDLAVLILGSLRYSSYMMHMQDVERKRMAATAPTYTDSGGGNYTTPSRSTATQTGDSDVMVASIDSGTNPSYVSLG